LVLSQNSSLLRLWGVIWSTTTAIVYLSLAMQCLHHFACARNTLDCFCHALLYPRLCAESRLNWGDTGTCFTFLHRHAACLHTWHMVTTSTLPDAVLLCQ
jgi:hypothetical protein